MATLADLLTAAQGSLYEEPVPQVANLLEQTRTPSPLDSLLRPYQAAIAGQPGGLGGFARQPAPQIPGLGGPTGTIAPIAPGYPTGPSGPTPGYTGGYSFTPIDTGRVPIERRNPPTPPSAGEITPEIQRVYGEIWARWPNSSNLGTHVVKYIRNNPANGLSQHSFGNAIDIGGPPEQLEEQASWLANHAGDLNISEVIFRDQIWTDDAGWHPYTSGGHDTHIHVTGPQVYSDTSPSFRTINWRPPRPERVPQRSTPRPLRSPAPAPSPRPAPAAARAGKTGGRTRTRHRRQPSPGELMRKGY